MAAPLGRKRVIYDDLDGAAAAASSTAVSSPLRAFPGIHPSSINHFATARPPHGTLSSPISHPNGDTAPTRSFNIYRETDRQFQTNEKQQGSPAIAPVRTASAGAARKRKRPSETSASHRTKHIFTSEDEDDQASKHSNSAASATSTSGPVSSTTPKKSPSISTTPTRVSRKGGPNLAGTLNGAATLSAAAAALLPPGTEVGSLLIDASRAEQTGDEEDVDEMDLFQIEAKEDLIKQNERHTAEKEQAELERRKQHLQQQLANPSIGREDWKSFDDQDWDDDFAGAEDSKPRASEADVDAAARAAVAAAAAAASAAEIEEGEYQNAGPSPASGEMDMDEGQELDEEDNEDENFDPNSVSWADLTTASSSGGKASGKARALTHAEVWDDSALVDAWEAAQEEYEVYHSRREAAKAALKQPGGLRPSPEQRSKLKSALWNEAPGTGSDLAKEAEQRAAEAHQLWIANQRSREAVVDVPQEVAGQQPPVNSFDKAPVPPRLQTPLPPAPTTQAPPAQGSFPTAPPPCGDREDMLQNVIMAWYWAGYYTAVYSGHTAS